MSSITGELAAALEQFGRPASSVLAARAESERHTAQERFPVEEWASLPLKRYALGMGNNEEVPYCQLLEYRTPNLGSIKGGSARKHIIYRRTDGTWWLAGELADLDPTRAWERLRAEFVVAIDRARIGDFDALDGLPLLRWGQALATKTFAVYAPQHFLDVYSGDHIRRFIRLFGGTPTPEATSWALNRQLLGLTSTIAPFSNWSKQEVLDFLYRHVDPRTGDAPILKVAPGDGARMWPECLRRNEIRVGFDEVGDLQSFPDDDAVVVALERAYPEKGPTPLRKLARQLLRYRDLPAGARIVANKGMNEVLAVGTVTEDGYRYDPGLPEYRHTVGVDWDTSYAQLLDPPARGWVPTFNNLTAAQWSAITAGRRPLQDDEQSRPDSDEQALTGPPSRDIQQVCNGLARKGQVIVHGPPGTGKTRLALTAALVLTGRATAINSSAEIRSAEIARMLTPPVNPDEIPQVTMTTFHPSLGYEDFVEGYKPGPAPMGGGLSLSRTDGLFVRICNAARTHPDTTYVLIIDEINRADLARVLGELITLLELDKRDHVTVRLPVSGNPFSVPRNVAIIGTMNTADRSVAHLDAAIRRRFGFVSAPPDPTVVETVVGPLNLATFLTELNQRVAIHLGSDHQLGHAYLLVDDQPLDTSTAIASAFYEDIVPQLDDSSIGDRHLLRQILGETLVDDAGNIVELNPEDLTVTLAAEFDAGETSLGV